MQKHVPFIIALMMCSNLTHASNPTPAESASASTAVSASAISQVSPSSISPLSTSSTPSVEQEDIASTEERLNNEVRILWDEIERAEKQQQQANDIKILPLNPQPKPNTTKTKPDPNAILSNIKNEKERIDAQLRPNKDKLTDKISKTTKTEKNDKEKDKTDKTKPIQTVIPIPPTITVQPKPVLTRKQVLEEEIAREKAALKSAQSQLLIARKRGNLPQIQKLHHVIRDRELNVQAISRELAR